MTALQLTLNTITPYFSERYSDIYSVILPPGNVTYVNKLPRQCTLTPLHCVTPGRSHR